MEKVIKFAATYMAPPFFYSSGDEMYHIEIHEMGLSKGLEEKIERWDRTFQSTFCKDNPRDSKFEAKELLDFHNKQGIGLFGELQKEQGDIYRFEYIPNYNA